MDPLTPSPVDENNNSPAVEDSDPESSSSRKPDSAQQNKETNLNTNSLVSLYKKTSRVGEVTVHQVDKADGEQTSSFQSEQLDESSVKDMNSIPGKKLSALQLRRRIKGLEVLGYQKSMTAVKNTDNSRKDLQNQNDLLD